MACTSSGHENLMDCPGRNQQQVVGQQLHRPARRCQRRLTPLPSDWNRSRSLGFSQPVASGQHRNGASVAAANLVDLGVRSLGLEG